VKQVTVIIPIYKSEPDNLEKNSFFQCQKILGHYPVFLVAPAGLDVSFYTNNFPSINVKFFDSSYFNSTLSYNRLMLAPSFYSAWSDYEYMLIYQLDAYVFKDELKIWCEKGFDYVGAPVHNFILDNFTPEIEIATLNGGFSLRKIASFLQILHSFHFIYSLKDLLNANLKNSLFLGPFRALYFFLTGNNTYFLLNKYDRNEDYFWAIIAPQKNQSFKVASVNESLQFSFDNKPEKSFELANKKLSFGCHAIDKNITFWKKHITLLDAEENYL
jgi:hypothetical protein